MINVLKIIPNQYRRRRRRRYSYKRNEHNVKSK